MEKSTRKFSMTAKDYLIAGAFVLTGTLIAGTYSYLATPEYESTAKLLIPSQSIPQTTLFKSKETALTAELKSREFLLNAIDGNPGLITTFVKSDYRTLPAEYAFPFNIAYRNLGNKAFELQKYTINGIDNHTYELRSMPYGIERVKKGTYGQELIDNNIALTITKKEKQPYQAAGLITAPEHIFEIHSAASKADELLNKNDALMATDENGVLTVTVRTTHPASSVLLANAIANNYLQTKSGALKNHDQSTNELEQISQRLAETEQEISLYKKQNQITDISADAENNLSMLKDLQLQKSQLEVQLAALDNLSNYLRKNRETNNSQVEYGLISDPAFADQLTKLNQKYEEKTAGKTTPDTDAEIENLKALISERILNTRKKTAVQIDKVSEIIASTEKNISRLPEKANTLLALERKKELNQKIYDLLIEKQASSFVNGAVSGIGGKIISPATRTLTPVYPVPFLMLAIGAITGLLASFPVIRVTASLKKKRVHNRSEISEVTRLPFIGTINDTATGKYAESLCTAVLMKPDVKIITLASTTASEGKTQTAIQLAQALAAIDKKVLLWDMNLEAPAIAEHYSVSHHHTLADVLNKTCDLHDAICLTSYPNLEILSAGSMTSGVNTLLSSAVKDEIINELKKHYDYIIIDTAATAFGVDAIAMMKISHLNLYVVKANTTRKSSLLHAERIQNDYKIENIHLILNSLTSNTTTTSKSRNRNRPINIQRQSKSAEGHIPGLLKRIALWFY